MSVIYLIRHGQASIRSRNYDKLSELGIKQSQHLGQSLKKRLSSLSIVQSGNLFRHRETAEHCLEAMRSQKSLVVNQGWNEYDHVNIIEQFNPKYKSRVYMIADMMKKLNPRRDFELMFDGSMERWMSGEFDGDYSESWPEFKKRTTDSIEELGDKMQEDEVAVVFTSGGTISSIVQHLMGLPDEFFMKFNKKIVNCSVTKVVNGSNGLFLSTLNDHGAFENDRQMITYV